jgi:hypothetical protein
MNVKTSFTVKMERPKLFKVWCCVPQCKSDGGKYAYMSDVEFFLHFLDRKEIRS